jgi:hypothetical protein
MFLFTDRPTASVDASPTAGELDSRRVGTRGDETTAFLIKEVSACGQRGHAMRIANSLGIASMRVRKERLLAPASKAGGGVRRSRNAIDAWRFSCWHFLPLDECPAGHGKECRRRQTGPRQELARRAVSANLRKPFPLRVHVPACFLHRSEWRTNRARRLGVDSESRRQRPACQALSVKLRPLRQVPQPRAAARAARAAQSLFRACAVEELC